MAAHHDDEALLRSMHGLDLLLVALVLQLIVLIVNSTGISGSHCSIFIVAVRYY